MQINFSKLPPDIIAMLKEDCESSGLVKRAAVTACSPLEKERTFVVALELEHPFLFEKLADSFWSRIKKSFDASKDIPLKFESWDDNIQKWVLNTPESVFYNRSEL